MSLGKLPAGLKTEEDGCLPTGRGASSGEEGQTRGPCLEFPDPDAVSLDRSF